MGFKRARPDEDEESFQGSSPAQSTQTPPRTRPKLAHNNHPPPGSSAWDILLYNHRSVYDSATTPSPSASSPQGFSPIAPLIYPAQSSPYDTGTSNTPIAGPSRAHAFSSSSGSAEVIGNAIPSPGHYPGFTGFPSSPPSNHPNLLSSPLSIMDPSPVKTGAGRPRTSNPFRTGRGEIGKEKRDQRTKELAARLAREKEIALQQKLNERLQKEKETKLDASRRARQAVEHMKKPESEGGMGFSSFSEFMSSLFTESDDEHWKRTTTSWARRNGVDFVKQIWALAPDVEDECFNDAMKERLQAEGKAIQKLLSRDSTISVIELLNSFSMAKLSAQLQEVAPTLWNMLSVVAGHDTAADEDEEVTENRRSKSLVLTCICSMLCILRSQKANTFQATIGLFLLGCGAAKREIAVLHHAGLSLSYTSILRYVREMSDEGKRIQAQTIRECVCSIVWDNINIPFRVGEERMNNKDHFDNGTAATLLVMFNGKEGTKEEMRMPHGSLPTSLYPPRTTTKPVFDWTPDHVLPSAEKCEELTMTCLWQLKRLAIDHIPGLERLQKELGDCPKIDQIPPHKTEQYAMSALPIDESSLDGTINVYSHILVDYLKMSDEELEKHGLLIPQGDLLTEGLMSKAESARRNTKGLIQGIKASPRLWEIFHAKMAGGRLTVNEHWGKPNSAYPGGLWWESTKVMGRKKMQAGWKGKKATPWRPAHQLLHLSLPAHIVDGFRLHCGHDDLSDWAETASIKDLEVTAQKVLDELFSSHQVEKLRKLPDSERDITLENAILYNRDCLFYIEFVHAVKHGDIGRVMNVLNIWMVMMRSVSTMPKYADAIFELLGRLKTYPPDLRYCDPVHDSDSADIFDREAMLRNWLVNISGRLDGFKEVDLLQEHQNFWLKVIYTAKGVNRSWKWLSIISVCIWSLRDAMRTVQESFKIPVWGTTHKSPSTEKDIATLVAALAEESIQSYTMGRPGNDLITPVRDLIALGAKYVNTRKAYSRFKPETRRATNIGVTEPDDQSEEEEDDELDMENDDVGDDEEPTKDDLAEDDEEYYDMTDMILNRAIRMIGDMEDDEM